MYVLYTYSTALFGFVCGHKFLAVTLQVRTVGLLVQPTSVNPTPVAAISPYLLIITARLWLNGHEKGVRVCTNHRREHNVRS